MTISEAKAAFFDECPVVFDAPAVKETKLHYSKISALIYRRERGAVVMSVELLDNGGHSVTIAAPERVTRADPVPAQSTFMPQGVNA